MGGRALRLYFIGVAAVFHRLRHDLGRELAVAVSSLVLFATFLYVFNDFLNVQVASLSGAMRGRFALLLAVLALGLAAAAGAGNLRRERAALQSLRRLAACLGEERGVVRAYAVGRALTVVALWHGAAWWLVARLLLAVPPGLGAAFEAAMLALTAALAAAPPRPAAAAAASGPVVLAPSAAAALAGWRWRQLLWRNRLTRLALALAGLFVGLVAFAAARGAPLFVGAAATLAAGFLAGAALCFQAAEDLPHAWVERSLGVTHDQFLGTYERLGLALGAAVGAAALAAHLAGGLWAPAAGPGLSALKLVALGVLPPLLVPQVMLQIDGRRPAINLLLLLITALFLGTAVLAHWLGLLLLPLVRYYARQTQHGRFYRA